MMSDNNYNREEECLGGLCFSSRYPSVFERPLTIKIRNVDLQTGLSILRSLSNEFYLKSILIQRGLGKHPQSPQMGGQIEDLRGGICL